MSGRTTDSLVIDAGCTIPEAIIRILKFEGTEFLSCYPTTPLIDAASTLGLRPYVCRQERTGVHIADGFSRTTGGDRLGVFAMQYGPGVENAYAGIATAYSDSSPILLLPLAHNRERFNDTRAFRSESIRSVTKSLQTIHSAGDLPNIMRRAFSQLRNGRPGPVVVELPRDLADDQTTEPLVYRRPRRVVSSGDPEGIAEAVRLLRDATAPMILAGQGILYGNASDALVRFAERFDLPVATTLEGKSAFPEAHDLALGSGAVTMSEQLLDALTGADVVVAVGASLTRHLMAVAPPRADQTVIHITNDPADLNKDCFASCPILGDARLVLEQLLVEADETGLPMAGAAGSRRNNVRAQRSAWLSKWAHLLDSDEEPINHYRVVAELNKTLDPTRSILTHDSGSPRDQIVPFYTAGVPHSYIGWGKSHALGTGLGLIMGAKLAEPTKTCVNVMGDAAFGMVGLDFETAVRNTIPIITVVLNNSTMATETRAMKSSHEIHNARAIGGNYANIATEMGGWSQRVHTPSDFSLAMKAAINATEEGQPALVELITSPEYTPFSHQLGRR